MRPPRSNDRRTARRRDEKGAVAIMVAFLAMVLFVVAALVVDLGLARDTKRQSQNAADASSLAAANHLYLPTASGGCTVKPCFASAVAAAKSYAAANYGTTEADWSGCTDAGRPSSYVVPVPSTPCISFDQLVEPSKVRVHMPTRTLGTGLGAAAGVDNIPVTAGAQAVVTGGVDRTCGLCFLHGVDAGNADFSVTPGSILVNGDLSAGPNSIWTAGGAVQVVGAVHGGQFAPPWTQVDAIPDPLASLAMPSMSGPHRTDPCKPASGGGGPGIYGTLEIPKTTCDLVPGTYVIVGTWGMKNNSLLRGTGVTLYVTCQTSGNPRACAPGESGGYLDFKNGEVELSAPVVAPNKDLAIVYDRNNHRDISLQGNGGTSITGTVYGKNARLDFNGNSCFGFGRGPIVVDGVVKANGTKSCVTVSNSVDANAGAAPTAIALDQ